MQFLYCDCEYSGFYSLDPTKSGELLQLAAVPVVDGVVHLSFNQYCRPLGSRWSLEAQKVHKIEPNFAKIQQHPEEMADAFLAYVKQFDCLFTMVGFNCNGDMNYLHRLMGKHMLEWKKATRFEWRDVYKRAKERKDYLPLKDLKLPSLAKHFGLDHNAHDALSDALMTKEIDERLNTIKVSKATSYSEASSLSQVEKRAKYTTTQYLMVNGEGSVYISEDATNNPEALKFVLEELWDTFVEGR